MNPIKFLQPDTLPIDGVCIILVLLSGIWQQKYLSGINVSSARKTLLVSLLVCAVYIVILALCREFEVTLIKRYFFSYFLATSLYELLLKKYFNQFFDGPPKAVEVK